MNFDVSLASPSTHLFAAEKCFKINYFICTIRSSTILYATKLFKKKVLCNSLINIQLYTSSVLLHHYMENESRQSVNNMWFCTVEVRDIFIFESYKKFLTFIISCRTALIYVDVLCETFIISLYVPNNTYMFTLFHQWKFPHFLTNIYLYDKWYLTYGSDVLFLWYINSLTLRGHQSSHLLYLFYLSIYNWNSFFV